MIGWLLLSIFIWTPIYPFPIDELIDSHQRPQENSEILVTSDPEDEERGCCDFATQLQPNLALSSVQALPAATVTTVFSFPGTISTPGQYVLVQNVSVPAASSGNSGTGLFVNANNVVIDLNDQTITGATNSVDGLCITTGMSNITIRNGTIRNMGRDGIRIIPTAGGNTNRFIRLENLNIIGCRNNGISISGGIDFTISNCIISNNGNIGLVITSGNNLTSQNFTITDCISSFNGSDGFQFTNCNNYYIRTILALNNGFNNGFGITPRGGNGIVQTMGNRITFENCQMLSNRFAGVVSSGNNHIFLECQSDNNGTDGFCIAGNNSSLLNCTAIQNGSRGFVTTGNNTTFESCEAKNNGATPPAGVTPAGFSIFGNAHCLLKNLAKTNTGAGFLLNGGANSSLRAQVRENTAVNNSFGIVNNGPISPAMNANRIYANFANDNSAMVANNFIGVPNVFVSPTLPTDVLNAVTNISN